MDALSKKVEVAEGVQSMDFTCSPAQRYNLKRNVIMNGTDVNTTKVLSCSPSPDHYLVCPHWSSTLQTIYLNLENFQEY